MMIADLPEAINTGATLPTFHGHILARCRKSSKVLTRVWGLAQSDYHPLSRRTGDPEFEH
jgi:hypothetical protein